jgi:hypothetical protein
MQYTQPLSLGGNRSAVVGRGLRAAPKPRDPPLRLRYQRRNGTNPEPWSERSARAPTPWRGCLTAGGPEGSRSGPIHCDVWANPDDDDNSVPYERG